jgi:hypothetical protein
VFATGDTVPVITALIGVSTPIMLGLLGMLVNGLTKHINSRMTELIRLTEKAARAEGVIEGSQEKVVE